MHMYMHMHMHTHIHMHMHIHRGPNACHSWCFCWWYHYHIYVCTFWHITCHVLNSNRCITRTDPWTIRNSINTHIVLQGLAAECLLQSLGPNTAQYLCFNIYICMCVFVSVCMYIYMYVCMYAYIYMCVCVCMCMCMCMCIFQTGRQLSSAALGMSLEFHWNFSGVKRTCWTTGSWRSCLSLEVVSSIPAGSTIIYRFLCGFICVSLRQSIKIKPTNMYIASARA